MSRFLTEAEFALHEATRHYEATHKAEVAAERPYSKLDQDTAEDLERDLATSRNTKLMQQLFMNDRAEYERIVEIVKQDRTERDRLHNLKAK